jgi:hypothetical protein
VRKVYLTVPLELIVLIDGGKDINEEVDNLLSSVIIHNTDYMDILDYTWGNINITDSK